MKRTRIAMLVAALLAGCGGARQDTAAILARIELDSDLPATCVDFQVRDDSEHVLVAQKVARDPGVNELKAAIFRGNDLPDQISIFARPMFGGGCADPNLLPNGTTDEQSAGFPKLQVTEVKLSLHRPPTSQDQDGDGFAGTAAGGPDCADDDPNIHPGAPEQCMSGVDMDCNGRAGCLDPACAGQACVAPPAQLALTTAPQQVAVGQCSGSVTVQAEDANGKAQDVAGNMPINLSASPSTNFTFYSDPGCTSAITLTTIAQGHHAASFYFRGTTAGTIFLTLSTSGISSITQSETLLTGPTAVLAITTPARTITAGACSPAITVQAQDAFGNAAPPTAATTISLSAAPSAGFTFYSDSACTTSVGQLPLLPGQGSATFYFQTFGVGSVQVTASAAGINAASQGETITSGMPATLTITTAPQTVAVGHCSGVVTLQTRDAWGNPAPALVDTTVGLASSPAVLTFFRDAACGTPITSALLPAGTSSTNLYFKTGTAGPVALTASAGIASATQTETITPASPTALAITSPPQSRVAGACSGAVTVVSRDGFGNPSPVAADTAVSLTASPSAGFGFYSDSGCSSAVTSVTISGGTNSQTFYFAGTATGTITLTASASGLSGANQAETITASPAAALAFTSAAQTLAAGTCSGQVTVQSRDLYGNPAPVTGDTTVNLSASPSTGFTFYSDAACSNAVTSTIIPGGTNATGFYFKGTQAQSVTISISASGLGPAPNQVETLQ